MNPNEVQSILDGLDRRLALGEIDIGTYHGLKAKFSAQLASPKDPLADAVSALPKEVVRLECPGCTDLLPAPKDPSVTILVCTHCGGSFTVQTAQSEMEKLRGDMKKWLSELAGGMAYSSTVDEASRRFIFTEKLFPSLKMDADRTTEIYAFARHQTFFSFPLLGRLPKSPFEQAVSSAPDPGYFVDRIKATITRVRAPEVLAFAMAENDKAALTSLEVQCQETIYLSNARKHLSAYTEEGFHRAVSNFEALENLYSKANPTPGRDKNPARNFSGALVERLKTAKGAVEALKTVLGPGGGMMHEQTAVELEALSVRCEQTALQIEQSGREARETVPAADGARTEAQTIRLLAGCLRLFGLCGGETGESFSEFLKALGALVDRAKDSQSDIPWLSDFLSRLHAHIESVSGQTTVAVLDNFEWTEASATAGAKSFLFGGKEDAIVEKKVLVPFWMGRLCFSQQSGIIFKKGQGAESLLFLNASRRGSEGGECLILSPIDPMADRVREASKKPRAIGSSWQSVVPVVSKEAACKKLKAFLATKPEYAGGYADVQQMIYLPLAQVKYTSKKGSRAQALTPVTGNSFPLYEINGTQLGTRKIAFLS